MMADSKEFAVPVELRETLPTEVGTIRVFGLQEGAVMSVYERHPNSTQRTRVVVGEGTWHVRAPDGSWSHDTVDAGPLGGGGASGVGDVAAHAHVVVPNAVHFVENRSGSCGGLHVNITWHSAVKVEDVIVGWEDEVAAKHIDTYHLEHGFHLAAKL